MASSKKGEVTLLSGGNPQIPKGDGDLLTRSSEDQGT